MVCGRWLIPPSILLRLYLALRAGLYAVRFVPTNEGCILKGYSLLCVDRQTTERLSEFVDVQSQT